MIDLVRRPRDRKSTRLNSSHVEISYAVFCLKKKTKPEEIDELDRRIIQLKIESEDLKKEHDPTSQDLLQKLITELEDLEQELVFFFNDTATTEIYTLSLHDALPIPPPGHRLAQAAPRRRRRLEAAGD